jgi:hypothetical protein
VIIKPPCSAHRPFFCNISNALILEIIYSPN